jgi:hypothetical protein
MGLNVQSSVTKNSINEVTNIVNKQVNTVAQRTRQTCDAANILNVQIGSLEQCGATSTTISGSTIQIQQEARDSCKINSNNNITITDQQLSTIKNDLKQLVQNQITNNQGFIPAAISLQSNVSISQTDINDNIDNISITDITQVCNNTVSSFNLGTLTICSDIVNSDIIIDQSADVYAVTQCTTTAIINNIFKTRDQRQVAQETDSKLASEQTGVTGLFRWLIIIAAIIAVVLIVGIIIFAVTGAFGGGDDKSKNGTGNQDQSQELQQILLLRSLEGGDDGI